MWDGSRPFFYNEWRHHDIIAIVKDYYYWFKIFLRFWLVKIPNIINHIQLLSTKYGRILRYVKNGVKSVAKFPGCCIVNHGEDLEAGLSCFGCDYKMAEHFTLFKSKKYANYWLKT